jgi:hypothetical protein
MLKVELSRSQFLFVVLVITIAPLVAGVLLLKNARAAGAILLALSMAGAFVFGLYYHFVQISPDHIFHLPGISGSIWVIAFQVTAVLLLLIEGIGVIAGIMALKGVAALAGSN